MNARRKYNNRRKLYSSEGNMPTVNHPNHPTDRYLDVGMAEHTHRGCGIRRTKE